MKFTGTFLTFDTLTLNDRIYPKLVMEKALKDAQEKIGKKTLLVERTVEFPFDGEPHANLANISGVVDEMHIEEDKLVGTISLMELPDEETMNKLYDGLESGKLSIRPKGFGNIGENREVSDYEFVSMFVTDKPA